MKTPIMVTNDKGNGSNMEIVILMAIDIANHIIWFIRNCLFKNPLFFNHIIGLPQKNGENKPLIKGSALL